MKILKAFRKILFFFLFFHISFSFDVSDVIINRISNSPADNQGDHYSSLGGGNTFYVKGSGFDLVAGNNYVFIGTYQANVIGVNDVFLIFESVAMEKEGDFFVSIVVLNSQTQQKKVSVCNVDCNIYYRLFVTTEMYQIKPRSAAPMEYVNFYGIDRFASTSKIESVRIGDFICDRVGLDESDISVGSTNFLSCRVAPEMIAGEYAASFKVENRGYATKYPTFPGINSKGGLYDFRCIPVITQVSNNFGSPEGQLLTIQGYGFSTNLSSLQVTAGDFQCTVISSDTYIIKCKVESTPLNSTLYIKGSGIERWVYDGIDAPAYNLNGNRNMFGNMFWNNNVTLALKSHTYENTLDRIPTDDTAEANIVEVWKAYFKAPTTGQYKFYLAADDNSELWLSNTSNSSNTTNLNKIAYSYSFQTYGKFSWSETLRSPSLHLEKDQFYLLNAFRNQGSGASHMWVGVEVPHNAWSPLKTSSLQMINITYNPIREIQELRINKYASVNQFKIIVQAKDATGKVIYYKATSAMTYNISASSLTSRLSTDLGWSAVVTRFPLNINGVNITNTTQPNTTTGYVHVIVLNSFRNQIDQGKLIQPTIQLMNADDFSVNAEIKQTQAPSATIAGNLTLKFNGTDYEVPGNESDISKYLNSIPGVDKNFYTEIFGSNLESHCYQIRFSGLNNTPILVVNNGLTGGQDLPTVSISEIVTSSNNIFYDPIPNELLYIIDDVPQITVSSDGILGKCIAKNCSYVIQNLITPKLESFVLNANGLTLTLSNYGNLTINASSIEVKFAGSDCQVTTVSLPSITCQIEKNYGNTLKIEAGSHKPSVHILGIGFTTYNSALGNQIVPLTWAALNNTNGGSLSGGQVLNITGSGFPLSMSSPSQISVKIADTECQIIEISNTDLIIRTPAKNSSATAPYSLILSMNGQTTIAQSYTYVDTSTPIVSALSPKTSSPSQKQVIKITGSNFGTDVTKVQVFLMNATNSSIYYQLSIVNLTSTTEIFAILGGGKIGNYNLKLEIKDVGYSKENTIDANLFAYDLSITAISPLAGSIYGGTLITFAGNNFSPINNQNQVFIGEVINNFCDIVSSNSTHLICQTRVAPTESLGSSQKIFMTQRVQDEALCKISGGCFFTFDSKISPQITSSSMSVRAGERVNLTGVKLSPDTNGFVWVTFLNGTTGGESFVENTKVKADLVTDTKISFIMPALREGSYKINVLVDNKGWAMLDLAFTLSTPLEIYYVSLNDTVLNQTRTGSKGGLMMTFYGNGFYNESIYIEPANTFGIVYNISKTSITFSTGPVPSIASYNISVYRNASNKIRCSNCSFTSLLVNTLTSHDSTGIKSSSFILNGFGTGLNNTSASIVATLDFLDSSNIILKKSYTGNVTTVNASNIAISFSNIPMGVYRFNILYSESGFAFINTATYRTITILPSGLTVATKKITSFIGGNTLAISGFGFPTDWSLTNINNITVCGSLCPILNSDINSVNCTIPNLYTKAIINNFSLNDKTNVEQQSYAIYGDNPASNYKINDNKINTVYDSNNAACYVIFDFGLDFNLNLTEIQYYPAITKTLKTFYGLKFQGSVDNITYFDLFSMNESMKTGWNTWSANGSLPLYRYFKLSPNATQISSRCNIAEVKLFGQRLYSGTSSLTSTICDSLVQLNGNKFLLNSAVEYRQDKTPIVQTLSPLLGPTSGGTVVTITGSGFGTVNAEVLVLMDDIVCVISAVTDKSITCQTGSRPTFIGSTFVVTVNGNNAAIKTDPFLYIDRWSDSETWGGESPPREGDSVYIPAGQNILIDISTPILNSVIIEGSLVFEDKDMTFDAYYLICMEGRVQIGTFKNPFQSKLVITMHGRKWFPRQLPEYGNKVWAFHNAVLDMHGTPKQYTWTVLAKTAEINDLTITVSDAVDWKINDKIAIASTDFNHNHSECRTVVAISSDKKTLKLNEGLHYRHNGQIEIYGSAQLPMQAEVALLTRNIVYQGSIDDVDAGDKYGAHLMFHMEGAIGRISYSEFTNVGQGFIIGRYPMHYHRIGDASDSLCIGNAVHESWARVVTIHGTHFLRVQKNVGYRVYGHNYFIEDGIETNNLLEDNLGISTIQIWTLINTDVTAATFWITNPNNILRRNRAAGGDWFGFWYQLENRVTGPSSNPDICPDGIELGEFSNNLAHSYFQGLRIFEYVPRTYPCKAIDDPDSFTTDVWYQNNEPIHVVFRDFIAYKNFEHGLLAEKLGSVEFKNFVIAESRISGIQISQTNFSREDEARVNGAIIIGLTQNNTDKDVSRYQDSIGFVTPRTDFLLINNVTFYNFSSQYNMSAFKSCSKCYNLKLKITGGKTTKFSKLNFINVEQKILWEPLSTKKEVFVDLDGTFTEKAKKGMITKYYPHLDSIPECSILNSTLYDDSIFCDDTVQIRPVMFRNPIPNEMYRGLEIRAIRIPNIKYNLSLANDTNFTRVVMLKIKIDTMYTWDLPFVTGYIYNIHWQNGNLDWTHMNFYPTPVWKASDKGVVFRFNYTDIREDYLVQVHKWGGTLLNGTRINETTSNLDPVTDNFTLGDYVLENTSHLLSLGINGKQNGTLDVDAIRCRLYCPVINDNNATAENVIRLWSNASMWPNGTLPIENSIVKIPQEWKVKLDINPPNLQSLIIDGELMFDPAKTNSTLSASIIWARLGNLTAGSAQTPFPGKILINMTGNKKSQQLLIDSFIESGSNILAVTGSLRLYGKTHNKTWSKLQVSAEKGQNVITLIDAVDWNVEDQIVIAPTESDPLASEVRTITKISSNVITLDSPLVNFHYGNSAVTYTADFGGVLDMRAGVGLLSRNIKISTNPANNWGLNILVYQFTDNNQIMRRGNTELVGVEISNGGQPDTERAALDIKYVKDTGPMNFIRDSSIYNGLGWCLNVYSSNNISIENNVFFNCEKFLTRALLSNHFSYISNLLVAPRKRNLTDSGLYDMVAGLDMYLNPIAKNTGSDILVTKNLVQGGGGNGFVIPGMVCGETQIGFRDNHVQSVTYAGLIIYSNNSECIELTDISISRCHSGVLSNFNSDGISINRMILAENDGAAKLWFAREHDDNFLNFTNIVFMALARPSCVSCYSYANACSNMRAILIPIVQIFGKAIPIDKHTPEGILSQCTDSAFDSKLIMNNITFVNYKINYSADANVNYNSCKNNYIFQQPSIPDSAARVYLKNTKALNSAKPAYFELVEPPQQFLFWRGGCGDFNCTGNKNWLLTDTDGSLFGVKSQVIPKIDGINSAFCSDVDEWNGRLCSGIHFGMLEFQNDGADQRLRLISPVNLTSTSMHITLNEWREWKWLGSDPLDKRLARFNGLIEVNNTMELEFEVVVPEEIKIKLENYGDSWWSILTIRYERPNVIEVWNLKNNTFIRPFRKDQNMNLSGMVQWMDKCGANIYDPDNSTITFILNNHPNCVLKIRTVNAIRITIHMETTVEDFYKNNGEAAFFDKISAFLKLDISRIRISKIRTGSVYVGFDIVENTSLSPSTSAVDSEVSNYSNQTNATQVAALKAMQQELINYGTEIEKGATNGTLNILNATILGVTTQMIITNVTINDNTNNITNNITDNITNNTNTSNNTNNTNITNPSVIVQGEESTTMIILLATLIPAFSLLFLLICCFVKNKNGISLIKLAFDYSNVKKEVELTFNQELIYQSKKESDKLKDLEALFDEKDQSNREICKKTLKDI